MWIDLALLHGESFWWQCLAVLCLVGAVSAALFFVWNLRELPRTVDWLQEPTQPPQAAGPRSSRKGVR